MGRYIFSKISKRATLVIVLLMVFCNSNVVSLDSVDYSVEFSDNVGSTRDERIISGTIVSVPISGYDYIDIT